MRHYSYLTGIELKKFVKSQNFMNPIVYRKCLLLSLLLLFLFLFIFYYFKNSIPFGLSHADNSNNLNDFKLTALHVIKQFILF